MNAGDYKATGHDILIMMIWIGTLGKLLVRNGTLKKDRTQCRANFASKNLPTGNTVGDRQHAPNNRAVVIYPSCGPPSIPYLQYRHDANTGQQFAALSVRQRNRKFRTTKGWTT
jgi:hypothetical protein